jgi:DNA-binding protein HU-beta
MTKSMNKEQLISAVAERTGKTKKDVQEVLNACFDAITASLKAGNDNAFAGFGSFKVQVRKATTGRNPRTGAEIKIPAKKVVKFSAAKKLKDIVN